MKSIILVFTFLLLPFISCNSESRTQLKVDEGIIDLRYKGFRETKSIHLNGDWEFYWNEHYRPSDFNTNLSIKPVIYGKVPAYWSDYDIPDVTNQGIATYRLIILLPDNIRHDITFEIPVFDSAYRMYIDGNLVASNGVAGETASESRPGYNPTIVRIKPAGNQMEIIINVTNFHHRRGGFWLPMIIGTPDAMTYKSNQNRFLNSVSNGILIAVLAFFILFAIIEKKRESMLYFSLTLLGIILRTVCTGSIEISYLLDISWVWLIRIEYLGSFIALVFGSWYMYTLFPDRIFKTVNTILSVLFGLAGILVLTTHALLFSNTIRLFTPVMIIIVFYYTIRSIISSIKGSKQGFLTMIGLISIMLGSINDSLLSNSTIFLSDSYILPYTFVILILTQVIILITNWVHSFNEERRLSGELEYVNKNLEDLVIERTSELTNQKLELEQKKNTMEDQNKIMEKTINLKNRIFSIIAHDLRSPIINLSLLINRLKESKDQSETSRITSDLGNQASFATNLITNLLVWGEGQRNKIQYNPSNHNLTDIVLECFNLLRENADRKSINLSYSHRGNPVAYCDKDLTSIVIRNIISNSIKFTNRDGAVSVLSEESQIHSGLVNIIITDNGIGISEEDLMKIKSSDLINSSYGTEGEKGTGLGLQLCWDLVRVNKGVIDIESNEGKGTEITISLPVKS